MLTLRRGWEKALPPDCCCYCCQEAHPCKAESPNFPHLCSSLSPAQSQTSTRPTTRPRWNLSCCWEHAQTHVSPPRRSQSNPLSRRALACRMSTHWAHLWHPTHSLRFPECIPHQAFTVNAQAHPWLQLGGFIKWGWSTWLCNFCNSVSKIWNKLKSLFWAI